MAAEHLIGIGGLATLFALLALRMPVGLAMVGVGVGGTWALSLALPWLRFEPYLLQFKSLFWQNLASYELSVVPLFVLMGHLAAEAGLARDLFRGIAAVTGRVRGGVAMAAIGASAGFGAVCGSSLATASTMGRVALPELRRLGYAPRLATGTLAAGGTLGILVPPSVALVIYAIIVEASVIEMFRAALLPGLLAVAGFMAVIAIVIGLSPGLAPDPDAMTPAERRVALLRLLPVLGLFGSIVAGLGAGLFTPTPAAAVGVFAIAAYGLFATGEDRLTLATFGKAARATAVTAGMIYFILFGAEVLKGFFTRAGIPTALAEWAGASNLDPLLVLALMLALLVVLGCFMESLSMILVVVPFFWPTLVALNGGDHVTAETAAFGMGSDELKIWFGILALVVVELGLITPPVGLNVFVISQMARDVPMRETFVGTAPFLLAEILRVGLLVAVPGLALWLPSLFG
jgi:tripartite ATP-independent transporter DctM subunit